MPPSPDRLSPYRAKRSLDRTPEPAGSIEPGAGEPGGLFVIHKHAARRLHYDLRLEMDGVLRSWAVPKGPSYDPTDKRLAVHVEDHPLDYGGFEGLIPQGNYGAGAVIVWDRGRWRPIEDPIAGLAKGKLLFELQGIKLRGVWTLVKLKNGQNEWLLIKERDGYAAPTGALPEQSVLSGLTVEDLQAGRTAAVDIRSDLEQRQAPRREIQSTLIRPMLAEAQEQPFNAPGWLFELKLDGYRALAFRDSTSRLLSRNGNDLSVCFPEIMQTLQALPFDRLVVDGELVALDDGGRPNFQRLQQRAQLRRALDIRHAAVECPVTFFAFDLLGFDEFDLRPLPLVDRKRLLQRVVPPAGVIRYLDHFETEGVVLYEQVLKLGLEGIVAKRAESPYKSGRSGAWIKIRTRRTDDFVVVGFTAPRGGRSGFGALHLGSYQSGELIYTGRAGSGFNELQLAEIRQTLETLLCDEPPCTGILPQGDGTRWVIPRLVCEVEYTERTEEGLLRQPVFLRFREDKQPEECVVGGTPPQARGNAAQALPVPAAVPESTAFTNLKKVFWPDDGYTKGDLIEYYRNISRWMLPYLADRPVVLTRYPNGISGKSFFQVDAPRYLPDWIRTERRWSEDAQREIDHFICEDEASLLYLINLGTIPLHIWGSRAGDIQHPDWCVLDLDPKGAPFAHVVRVAQAARALCEQIGLPCLVKTSGSSGLHLMIPLAGQCLHEHARSMGELLGRVLSNELPEIATVTRQVSRREGKVYLDYLQNGAGRLIVAPFSVRPLPGAPVSTPLRWSEVTEDLDIRRFTIANVPERMRKLKRDPLRGVLDEKPNIPAVLERLRDRR
jgi:bifunctional non-homologous end joining protein LigD